MTTRGSVWTSTQTTNGQYGQWFDSDSRRSTPTYVVHRVNSKRRQPPASRDPQPPVTSQPVAAADASSSSWRPATANPLPLSLQRSMTTLGVGAHRLSGSATDSLSGEVHADLIRDYRRYRQLQAGIASETTPWRDTSNRLLTRPSAGGDTSSSHVQSTDEDRRTTDTETTTVVPLQLGVGGPVPLQRSVANAVSARHPHPHPGLATVGRAQSGYSAGGGSSGRPLSSLVNNDNNLATSNVSDVARQHSVVAQVRTDTPPTDVFRAIQRQCATGRSLPE